MRQLEYLYTVVALGTRTGLETINERSFAAAQEAVAADDRPGAVLVLPWSAYRGPDWAGRATVVLDPATKLFDRRTLWNDDLVVGTPDGGEAVVTGEDARARRAAGVRWLLASSSGQQ